MLAAYLAEPGRIELRNQAIPQADSGGIVVRVRAALTDGTDLKAFRRGHPQMPMPTRFGHEFSGDVSAVGHGVEAFSVGDAVMCVHSAPCGLCYWCKCGEAELCESVMATKILGAYAQYIAVPAHIVAQNCFHKPDALSYIEAAFLESLACVVHSVEYARTQGEDSALVFGDGGFGLLHAAVLHARGVRTLLVGRRDERLTLARYFGIAAVVDARHGDVEEHIFAFSDGRGVDVGFECTGSEEVWEKLPGYLRRGGKAVFFGGLPASATVAFSAARMHYDEVKLLSPFHFAPSSVRIAYEMLTRKAIDVAALVTDTSPLAAIADIFTQLDRGVGIKFAIEP